MFNSYRMTTMRYVYILYEKPYNVSLARVKRLPLGTLLLYEPL